MSSLPKRRRVKRPTIVVKRSQLTKNSLYKKRSYKPLYEKLKANNNALAKALSKEKQECQYLFAEKIGLTSEVQELKVACNRRDDVISAALKNAKETLQLLITMSNHVTNTIASCQQLATTTRYTPRRSTTNDRRESSMRRLSGKSPARGVVQPMVSGHTITKPTINLSRLNIQREYRVQNPPNLSDIEESLTPEASPAAPARPSPVRIPITRPLNYGATRVNRLPERLQNSMRTSDESERRSSVRSNRNSGRRSARRSRESSSRLLLPPSSPRASQAAADTQNGECLRSPRVALHDVSRLLHNSQSVNIRTLLENSSDIDVTQPQQFNSHPMNNESTEIVDRETTPENPNNSVTDTNVTNSDIENSDSHDVNSKSRNSSINDTEDPLEGPSWMLDSVQSNPPSNEIDVTLTTSTSTLMLNAKEQSKNNRSYDRNESRRASAESQSAPFVNSRSRGQRLTDRCRVDEDGDNKEPEDEYDDNEDEHVDKEAERAANLATQWANQPTHFFKHLIDNAAEDDDDATSNLSRFVTRKRGSSQCDTNEFTLMIGSEHRRKNYNFDINDLQLPVLESPIAPQVRPIVLEPELTTNVQRITLTHNCGHLTPDLPRLNVNETVFDHTGLMLPIIGENEDSPRASTALERDSDDDNDARSDKRKRKRLFKKTISPPDPPSDLETTPTSKTDAARRTTTVVEHESDEEDAKVEKRKRKRTQKKKANPPDSPSDTEYAPTPKRKNVRSKRKPSRAKDPSSAKVVLLKLNENHVKKTSPSPETGVAQDLDNRQNKATQRDVSSDSDASSVASLPSKIVPTRPRRQKAPTNMQEPSLGKKLRRN